MRILIDHLKRRTARVSIRPVMKESRHLSETLEIISFFLFGRISIYTAIARAFCMVGVTPKDDCQRYKLVNVLRMVLSRSFFYFYFF